MLRLIERQRDLLSEKLFDAANIAAGALVFVQALSQERFSSALAVFGAAAWVGLVAWALKLSSLKER